MAEILTCPHGHQWEATDRDTPLATMERKTCPICGAAAETVVPNDSTPDAPKDFGLPPTVPQSVEPMGGGVVSGRVVSGEEGSTTHQRIPGYELLEELGRGGMGVVYKARQVGLKRIVALKMILAGPHASRQDLDLFRAEAEAVAKFQHPNIVQIYEIGEWQSDGNVRAGSVSARLPCFSLEYVDGGSLAKRLQGQPQPPAESAHLVETLARAMDYAHQRGIVHRDLKPGNILLASVVSSPLSVGKNPSSDGLRTTDYGQPKIADFGLAKQVPLEAEHAETRAIKGTPSYMAPEQATERTKLIGPATDVYALGAILYEMLTGRPPFRGTTLLETLEQVRTQEPVPPRQLQPKVPRDVETICLKCLQKEARKRYSSASGLADDLRRFLNGEPILARPVGAVERAWRWCRRKPLVAGLTAGVAVLLVAVSIVSVIFAIHSENARQQIEERQRKVEKAAEHARQVIESMSSEAALDHLSRQEHLTKEQRDLLEKMIAYYQEHAQQAAETEQERVRQALAYFRIGLMLNILGRHRSAEEAYRHALAADQALLDAHPGVPKYAQKLARTHNNLGLLLRDLGNWAGARRAFEAALKLRDRLAAEHPAVPEYAQELAGTHNNLGMLLRDMGDWVGARQAYQSALNLKERRAAENPSVPAYADDVARTHDNLGILLRELGDWAGARQAYEAALKLRQRLMAEHPAVPHYAQGLAGTHNNLGSLLGDLGDRAGARQAYEAALKLLERLAAEYPGVPAYAQDLAMTYNNLGLLLGELGDRKARQAFEAARKLQERLAGEHPAVPTYARELARTHNDLGKLLHELGDRAGAREAFQAALKLQERLAAEHPGVPAYAQDLAGTHNNLGALLDDLGDRAGARQAHEAALKLQERVAAAHPAVPEYAVGLGTSYSNFASLLGTDGEPKAALDWYARAIGTLTPIVAREPRYVTARESLCNAHWGRATALHELGRYREALADWDRALEHDNQKRPIIRSGRAVTLARLAEHAQAIAEAEELARDNNADADVLYNAASVLALSAAAINKAPSSQPFPPRGEREKYAARAVELLRQAVAKGYKDVEHMRKDKDLDPLRERADFKKLLSELEQQAVELIPPPREEK